jgi:hypothetical protein
MGLIVKTTSGLDVGRRKAPEDPPSLKLRRAGWRASGRHRADRRVNAQVDGWQWVGILLLARPRPGTGWDG